MKNNKGFISIGALAILGLAMIAGYFITPKDVNLGAGSGTITALPNRVKISSNDTTSGFLEDKLVAGSNISLTTNNDGGNETITIESSGGGGGSSVFVNTVEVSDPDFTDSSEIEFGVAGSDVTASIATGSIDETKLDVSTNASLDLADTALQSGDNISVLTNDSGYITGLDWGSLAPTPNIQNLEENASIGIGDRKILSFGLGSAEGSSYLTMFGGNVSAVINPLLTITSDTENNGIDLRAKGDASINILGTGDYSGELRFYERGSDTSVEYVGLQSPDDVVTAYTLTLPTDLPPDGTDGLLQSNTSGTLSWIDPAATFVTTTGDQTIAGVKTFSSNIVTSGGDCTANNEYCRKSYIDAFAQGITIKPSVRVATTGAGTLASDFENGDTIDGITLATGNRILIKNQAASSANGIYIVKASGAPDRATDYDTAAEVLQGTTVSVLNGTVNNDTLWVMYENDVTTLGTDPINFTQLAAPSIGTYTTGTSGTDFNISQTGADAVFNLPIADGTNTGKLSNTDWTTFDDKINGAGTVVDNEFVIFDGTGGKDVQQSGLKIYADGLFTPGPAIKPVTDGDLFILRGSDNAGNGGSVIIAGGVPDVASDGNGGGVGLLGEDGDGEGDGGGLSLLAGSGVLDTGGRGGSIDITAGAGTTAGDITITGGFSQDELNAFTTGGTVTVQGGATNSSLGSGGTLNLFGGGGSTGTGGSVNIASTNGTIDGGNVGITAGNGTTTAGAISLSTGVSTSGSTGGAFSITTGNGDAGGGTMTLTTGSSTNTGAGGDMVFNLGAGAFDENGGSVNYTLGEGFGSGDGGSFNITFGDGSPAGLLKLQDGTSGFSARVNTYSLTADRAFSFNDEGGVLATDTWLGSNNYLRGPVTGSYYIPRASTTNTLEDSVYSIDTDPIYATPAIMRPETNGISSPFIIRAASSASAFTPGGPIYLLGGDVNDTDSFQTGGSIFAYAGNGNGTTGSAGGAIDIIAGSSTGIGGGDITIQSGEVTNFGPIGGDIVLKVGGSTDGNATNGDLKVRTFDIPSLTYYDTTLGFPMTANRNIQFQDADGTVAFLSDIAGGGGGTTWGTITGTLSSQSDLQSALDLKVTGPATATDNAIARYNTTTGELIQDSGITISDVSGGLIDVNVPTADDLAFSTTNGFLQFTANGTISDIEFFAGRNVNMQADDDIFMEANQAGGGTGVTIGDAGFGAGSGPGGTLTLYSGNGGSTSGGGGDINLASGNALAGNSGGGLFTLTTGNGFGTGDGGDVFIWPGDGGSSTGGEGGDVEITPGNATGGNSSGGGLVLQTGNSTGTGTGKDIDLILGTVSTGTPGKLDLYQPTAGAEIFRIRNDASATVSERMFQGNLTTTDATIGTILTLPLSTISANGLFGVEWTCLARNTASPATTNIYHRITKAEVVASVASSNTTSIATTEDAAAWDCTILNSGGSILFRATGAAATSIEWTVYARVMTNL